MRQRGPPGGPVLPRQLRRSTGPRFSEARARWASTEPSRNPCPATKPLLSLRSLLGRRSAGLRHRHARLLLADARRLAGEVAKVVELRAANAAAANHRHFGQHGAVHREDALHPNAVRDLPHRERLAHAGAATRDAHALERLNALLFAFLHAHVHAKGVTRTERGNIAEPLFLGFDECMHMTLSSDGSGVVQVVG